MIKNEPQKLPKNNSALSGEYFVAAELYRHGYSVGMTIGNAKSVDLFAEMNGKTHQVQVKTIINKKSGGWPIRKKQLLKDVFYIFVNLNDIDTPEYYILLLEDADPLINDYVESKRGVLQLGKIKGKKEFLNRWDRIK
jgi:hypothetical protein